jgi:ParB family protein of integrating conjugative element (PFGI_1 class)
MDKPKYPKPKRPDGQALQAMLLEGNFGSYSNDERLPLSDPISITQMVLTLSEIKPYDQNPRQLINPAYVSIKESVRIQRRLNNPFNVTRRPGDELYMVQAGGNTRLAVLRELYAETADEAFNRVQCLFVPWTNEHTILTAHLIENELRGEMALIDKAYALRNLRTELEKEQGSALSDRAFIKTIAELGYKLSGRQAGRLDYLLALDQLIPKALREGAVTTIRQLDTIKSTEKAYISYAAETIEQMPAIFARAMAAQDGEAFDFGQVRKAIELELSPQLNVPELHIALHIDALLAEDATLPQPASAMLPPEPNSTSGLVAVMPQLSSQPETLASDGQATQDQNQAVLPVKQPSVVNTENPSVSPQVNSTDKEALPSLQQRGFTLALQIAQDVKLEHLVLPCASGMGFVVEKPALRLQNHTERGTWWILLALSEPDHAVNGEAATEANGNEQGRDVLGDSLALPVLACKVMANSAILSDRTFNDLVKLFENCRTLQKQFPPAVLWPEPASMNG